MADLHPAAQRELWEAIEHYEGAVPGLGLEFLESVERATNLLAAHPEAGERYRIGRIEVRRWPLERFPFILVYDLRPGVVVVAVAHTSRKPGYWAHRI